MKLEEIVNWTDIIPCIIYFWMWYQFIITGDKEWIWLTIGIDIGMTLSYLMRAYIIQIPKYLVNKDE